MNGPSSHRAVFLEDGAQVDFDQARVAILPVPYEATVSYGRGTAGGPGWARTMSLLERLLRRSRVVACDVVELAPRPGMHHADFTVARLVYRLIGFACGGGGGAIGPRFEPAA